MTLEIILIFAVIAVTVLLFITEWFPIDKISFLIIVSLVLLGLTKPEEAISGFSSPATITVLALMIIAIGLEDNGVIDWLTQGIKRISFLPLILLIPAFMLVSASISAFISTTAVVVIFIKIMSQLAEKYNFSRAKLLMPISFAGILGGSCTLMGTSTNLLVNSVAQDLGAEKLGFFEFTLYGLVLLAVGIIYMTIASRFLPKDSNAALQNDYNINDYIFSAVIPEESSLIGVNLGDTTFFENPAITIAKLVRDGKVTNAPGKYIKLEANDKLLFMGDLKNLEEIISDGKLIIGSNIIKESDEEKQNIPMKYVELMVMPGSNLIGLTLNKLRKMPFKGAVAVAMNKNKTAYKMADFLTRRKLKELRVTAGDRILLETQEVNLNKLHAIDNVALLNSHEFNPSIDTKNKVMALVILLGVIGLASSGVLSILAASLTGVAALLLTNLISLEKIYHRVNWQIVFLLAGMIPLGIAMSNTEADKWISDQLITILQGQNNMIVLGCVFLCTMIISGFISNNATAVIMTPIAMALAAGLSLSEKPFIIGVMLAANFSFFTPVGYQTNALIYGTGLYKFKHFLIIGGILSIILLVTATLLLSTLF